MINIIPKDKRLREIVSQLRALVAHELNDDCLLTDAADAILIGLIETTEVWHTCYTRAMEPGDN